MAIPSGVLAASLTAEAAPAAVSPALLVSTVRAATAFASGMMAGASAAGMVSAGVVSLAEGVSSTMFLAKWKIVGGAALVGMLTLGVGAVGARQLVVEEPRAEEPADEPSEVMIARLKVEAAESALRVRRLEGELKSARAELEAARSQASVGPPGLARIDNAGVGSQDGPKAITYLETQDSVVSYQPKGTRLPAYSVAKGEWASYEVPRGVEVVPVTGSGVVAVTIIGDEIRQLAAFSPSAGSWVPIDLKEPARGRITPIVHSGMAVYPIGRRVYAFSAATRSWDVVELPEGSKPMPSVSLDRATVKHEDHLYLFSVHTGKWTDFDARTGEVVMPGSK